MNQTIKDERYTFMRPPFDTSAFTKGSLEKNCSLRPITDSNQYILMNLAQAYEAEFSLLTGKMPDENGHFKLDTQLSPDYQGYLFYVDITPVGFCILNTKASPMYVAEFYVIPSLRRKKVGTIFAQIIFKGHPGNWQVSQIEGASHAIEFWRKVIRACSNGGFKEENVIAPDWGPVTRQSFTIS